MGSHCGIDAQVILLFWNPHSRGLKADKLHDITTFS